MLPERIIVSLSDIVNHLPKLREDVERLLNAE
jgi:hypothetical protein